NNLAGCLSAWAVQDAAQRAWAAHALVKRADPAATEALIEALQDDYWSVRMHASHALARIGGSRVVEALIPMLGDSIKECRDGAVDDFAAIGSAAGERLGGALRGGRGRGRGSAGKALGVVRGRGAVAGVCCT